VERQALHGDVDHPVVEAHDRIEVRCKLWRPDNDPGPAWIGERPAFSARAFGPTANLHARSVPEANDCAHRAVRHVVVPAVVVREVVFLEWATPVTASALAVPAEDDEPTRFVGPKLSEIVDELLAVGGVVGGWPGLLRV